MWRREVHGLGALVGGLAFGFGGFCASTALASVAGVVSMGGGQPFSAPVGGLLVGLTLTAFQSISEETYFRGWLQPVVCANWGPWLGLVATSVLFAGLHLIAGAHGVLAVVNLLLGGLLFGLLALRSGGLVAPAAAHFAWNWTESDVLGLDPGPTGRIFDLQLRGSTLWSGGADTMNGSLAMTIVLSALVLTLMAAKSQAFSRSGRRASHRSDLAP
jgi:membrane protease YdiL (CAAX protease family)